MVGAELRNYCAGRPTGAGGTKVSLPEALGCALEGDQRKEGPRSLPASCPRERHKLGRDTNGLGKRDSRGECLAVPLSGCWLRVAPVAWGQKKKPRPGARVQRRP